jgi:hypothetical protein
VVRVTIEIEATRKPACVAETVRRFLFERRTRSRAARRATSFPSGESGARAANLERSISGTATRWCRRGSRAGRGTSTAQHGGPMQGLLARAIEQHPTAKPMQIVRFTSTSGARRRSRP